MKRAGILSLAFAFSSLLLASSVNAGEWFAEAGSGAMYLKLPNHGFFRDRRHSEPSGLDRSVPGDEGNGADVAFALKLGWAFDRPLANADATTVETSGFYSGMEDVVTDIKEDPNDMLASSLASAGFFGDVIRAAPQNYLEVRSARDVEYAGYDVLLRQSFRDTKSSLFSVFAGFSAIHLHQNLKTDVDIGDFVHLKESLDANYFGGKIGTSFAQQVADNWALSLDGAVGFYGAYVQYDGAFDATSFVADPPLNLSDTHFALGLQASGELIRQVGDRSFVSCFAELRHLGYAPQMAYINALATSGAAPTRIVNDELLSVMLGLRVTFFH